MLVEQQNVGVARILIEHDAYSTQANKGWTLLHEAVEQGSLEIIHLLIKHGEDMTAQADDRWTLASSCRSVEIAHLLVEHGADVTARGDDGRTPLDMATELGNVDLIYILIEGRTDVTTPAQPMQDRGRLMYYAGVLLVVFGLFAALYLHFKQT